MTKIKILLLKDALLLSTPRLRFRIPSIIILLPHLFIPFKIYSTYLCLTLNPWVITYLNLATPSYKHIPVRFQAPMILLWLSNNFSPVILSRMQYSGTYLQIRIITQSIYSNQKQIRPLRITSLIFAIWKPLIII